MDTLFKISIKSIKILVATLFCWGVSACSSTSIEPEIPELHAKTTRSDQPENSQFRTAEEALEIANRRLSKSQDDALAIEISYITQDSSNSDNTECDTVAYLINYSGNKGFAVIARDRNVKPLLMYAQHTNYDYNVNNTDFRITDLIECNSGFSCSEEWGENNTDTFCGDHHHEFIPSIIDISVHEGAPYNSKVQKSYPECLAGSGPTCCAILASYGKENLVYKGYEYSFSSIRYCLNKGKGFETPMIPYNSFIDIPPYVFVYGYAGSVDAISQLIFDFGKYMNTSYSHSNSETDPYTVYQTLHNLGYDVSSYSSNFDLHSVCDQLRAGYLIFQYVENKSTGKKSCVIIDGAEIIYDVNPNEYDQAHLEIFSVKDGEGFHYGETFQNSAEQRAFIFTCNFGVKVR